MIHLTRLDGISVYLNAQNIQWIESRPDTVVTFLGGARVIVRESIDEVIRLISFPTNTAADCQTNLDTDPLDS